MSLAGAARAASPAPIREREARPSAPAQDSLPLQPTLLHLARLYAGSLHCNQFAEESWPTMIRLALGQGVAPLLYLQTKGQPLPAAASTELRKIYRANLARNVALDEERAALQAELTRQAGAVMALKGPQLAVLLYGDPGARQVADVDLLIQPEHLPAADRVLAERGFVREPASLAQLQRCRDICYSRPVEGRGEFCVDLHLRLRPYGNGDRLVTRLWREGMTRENLLLVLCLNLMVHRWARLQPLLDVVALLRQGNLNWNQFNATAQELEWSAGVGQCLRFASQLAGMDVPLADSARSSGSRMQRRWLERLLGRTVEQLLGQSRALDGPFGTLALLACENGIGGKLRLASSILLPPRAALRQMDAAGASLPLALHYAQRAARKAGEVVKVLAGGQGSR